MKKLCWIDHHIYDAGGFGTVTNNILNRLKGYDKHLIAISTKTLVPRQKEIINDIKIYYAYTSSQIGYWVKKIKPDIIVLYGAYPHIKHFDQGCPEKLKVPFIIYGVTDHPPIPFGLRRVYRRADKVLVPSEYSREVMRKALIPNVDILYHGVDLNLYKPMPTKPLSGKNFVYGCVANNNLRKQFDRLLRAFKIVNKGVIALMTEPTVVHSGMVSYNLPELIEYLELKDKVIFNDYLSNGVAIPSNLMPYFYNQFDVHVLPTAFESGGLTYLESMACGIPNITTDGGCARELIGDSGLYIKVKDHFFTNWGNLALVDVDDLADKMNMIYNNNDLLVELATKGLNRIKQFTWDRTIFKLRTVLEDLL